MNSTFSHSTPHGGPAFQSWKKGYGFGRARGAGLSVLDPCVPSQLRYTPSGDRCFASSQFWRRRGEVGQANSFGIGDRPDYGRANRASFGGGGAKWDRPTLS